MSAVSLASCHQRLDLIRQTVTHTNAHAARYNLNLLSTQTRKALTRGRTDHFVTYSQFPINVCFLTAETELLFPVYFHPARYIFLL